MRFVYLLVKQRALFERKKAISRFSVLSGSAEALGEVEK